MYLSTMLTEVLKDPPEDHIAGMGIMTDGVDSKAAAGAVAFSFAFHRLVYSLEVPDKFRYNAFGRLNRVSFDVYNGWEVIERSRIPDLLGDCLAVVPNYKFLMKIMPEAEDWNVVEIGDLMKVRDGGLYCRPADLKGFVDAVRNYGKITPRMTYRKVVEKESSGERPVRTGTHGEQSAGECRYQALRLAGYDNR